MHTLINEWEHMVATSYVGLASYTFLIYDHILTFSDEVEYIWRRKKGLVTYLFFLIRYFFPLAFIVNLYAYLSREFDHAICKHFVRYEGALAIIGFGVAGLMMIVRVNALYGGRCRLVQVILGTLWFGQLGVYAWLLCTGMPVPHSVGIHSCSLIFDPRRMNLASLVAAAPLIFDTAVVLLTLYKTLGLLRKSGSQSKFRLHGETGNMLMETLVSDGVLYYIVVFSSNLAWTIMIVTASPGIKNILGQFAQIITVTMMSRITLHLRKIGANRNSTVIVSNSSLPPSAFYHDGAEAGSECTALGSEVTFARPRTSIDGAADVSSMEGPSIGQGNRDEEDGMSSGRLSLESTDQPDSWCSTRHFNLSNREVG